MIKNFENFVNENEAVCEGKLLDNILAGLDAGFSGFKANKNVQKAAEEEMDLIMSGNTEVSDKVKMTTLVKQLLERSAWLANDFSWEKLLENPSQIEYMDAKLERIEDIISKMKELLHNVENVKE